MPVSFFHITLFSDSSLAISNLDRAWIILKEVNSARIIENTMHVWKLTLIAFREKEIKIQKVYINSYPANVENMVSS